MIELKQIYKSFGDNKVLSGINLNVARGEVVAILGPSGSGKTTLLRCMNYLEKPDSGHITLGDFTLDYGKHAKKTSMPYAKNQRWYSSNIICSATKLLCKM